MSKVQLTKEYKLQYEGKESKASILANTLEAPFQEVRVFNESNSFDDDWRNMLIFGDNLMALKSKYSGITSESRAIELDLGIFASKVEYGMIKNIKERNAFKFYKDNVIGLSDKVKTGEQFKNFMIVMEAIVAYFPKQKD